MIDQAKVRGQSPPKFLQDKPELNELLIWYWESFWELSTTRNDMGQIPWTAINEYANRWGINSDTEFDTFIYFIRSMDSVFLDKRRKELERDKNNG